MRNLLLAVLLIAGYRAGAQAAVPLTARLDKVRLTFALGPDGRPTYAVAYGAKTVIQPSRLGLSFADGKGFEGPLTLAGSESKDVDETWQPVWGEVKSIRNHYQQLTVHLRQPAANGRRLDMVFRVFADGVGFRYEVPAQPDLAYFTVQDEHTEFRLPANHKAFWIPGDYDSSEYAYTTSRLSEQLTADRHIMVDMHEAVRPTGLHRTYPNWLANEAARGNEFNAWSSGNPPEHETILPFTRLMGGPMDYTPGIFQIKLDDWNPARNKGKQVHTTLAKQLALYVTMYSPLQMAADLPEAYNQHLDAFQFIEDVAVEWDDTRILAAEPGDYLTTARRAKGKDEWYLGAITDENARTQTLRLDFLTPGQRYEAVIYADGAGADWQRNPMAYRVSKQTVSSKSTLTLQLAPGGGAAVSFKPVKK